MDQFARTFKRMPTADLIEHPRNIELFDNISERNPGFWEDFKDNIGSVGVLEALVVNQNTNEVISGNQRLRACLELGIEEVPCLLVNGMDEAAVREAMISTNVIRRQLDPFKLFEYIQVLRSGFNAKPGRRGPSAPGADGLSTRSIRQRVGKDSKVIVGAEIYASLPDEDKETVRAWYHRDQPTQTQLLDRLKKEEKERLTANLNVSQLEEKVADREEQIANLRKVAERESEGFERRHQNTVRQLEHEKRVIKKELNALGTKTRDMLLLEKLETQLQDITNSATVLSNDISAFIRLAQKNYGADMSVGYMDAMEANAALESLAGSMQELGRILSRKEIEA